MGSGAGLLVRSRCGFYLRVRAVAPVTAVWTGDLAVQVVHPRAADLALHDRRLHRLYPQFPKLSGLCGSVFHSSHI